MKVIMVSGKQGAGKSSLCDSLGEVLAAQGYDIVRKRFASVLYEMHDAVLDIARRYGITVKDKDGPLLQLIGTEWGRKTIDENMWVNCLQNVYKSFQKHISDRPFILLVEDLRFINEFEGFPDAVRIRLTCPRDIRRERAHSWRDNETHPSEVDLDEHEAKGLFDLVIDTSVDSKEVTLNLAMVYLESRGLCGDTRGLQIAE